MRIRSNFTRILWFARLIAAILALSALVLAGDPAHLAGNAAGSILNRVRQWCWGKLMWPYGCLGRTGWLGERLMDEELRVERSTIRTRWFRGGHGCYFAPGQIEQTFEQMYEDIECHVYATSSSAGRGD